MNLNSHISLPFLCLLILLFTGSCGEKNNNRNNPAFLEELANRELKKVSDADIMTAAYEQGRIVAKISQDVLLAALQEKTQNEGISNALAFCNNNAYPLADSIGSETRVEIKRVSFKTRNQLNKPDSLESMLLDSYSYNVENNLDLDDNVQKIDDDYLLYTKPITIDSPICLQCHGKIGSDISAENYEIIKKLYPLDEAIGYHLGDFRGMWSIKLSKKEIIKAL